MFYSQERKYSEAQHELSHPAAFCISAKLLYLVYVFVQSGMSAHPDRDTILAPALEDICHRHMHLFIATAVSAEALRDERNSAIATNGNDRRCLEL